MEAVGHKEAFYFVQDLVKEQALLSENVIKQIHSLVMADKKNDRGGYRRVPVRILEEGIPVGKAWNEQLEECP